MIKRLTLVLTLLFVSHSILAQEVYLSISGRSTSIVSGDSRNQYDIWIKPSGTPQNGKIEIFDAGLGGAVDIVTQNGANTSTSFSLFPFDELYSIENGTLRSKSNPSNRVTQLSTQNEERFKNRWVALSDIDNTSSNGYIIRVSTDNGDDVNSFNFRVSSPTGQILSGQNWQIIGVDLSIGLFNSQRSSVFQLKPYLLQETSDSPRLVASGQEDSRVRKIDSFGEIFDLSRSGIPASKFGLKNNWGLNITGSSDRINTLTVYGFDSPVLWLLEPFVSENNRKPNLGINEVPTQQCTEKTFELAGNDFNNAEISNSRWILDNQQVASGKTPTISSDTPGELQYTVLIPNQRSPFPEYWTYTKSVFINSPPVARVSVPKRVISPTETILLSGSNSYDIEGKPLTYQWYVNGSPRGNSESFRFSSTISGTYNVTLRVSDGGSNPTCAIDERQIQMRVNTQPYAELNIASLIGTNENVTATVSNQTDADNDSLIYSWRGVGITGSSNGKTVTVNHSDPGSYTINLTLDDGSGSSNGLYSINKRYEVNAPPVPLFTLREKAAPGDNITFDAGSSTDGNNNPLTYKWFVNDNLIASEAVTEFQFSDPGAYRVKLIVDDGRGVSNSVQELTKTVRINTPPQPVITAAKVTSSSRVTFSAEQSSDSESALSTYRWNFGDGNTATGPRVQHTYSKTGEYRVTLQVNDGEGLSNSSRTTEHILLINQYPIADFNSPVVVAPGQEFTLDGSLSTDSDGLITSYEWYNEGELIGTGSTITTSLSKTGNANISLRVKDDSGYELAEGIKTKKVRVNTPPTAVWVSDADYVAPNKEIRFSAAESYDLDGSIARYRWEFNDGVTLRGRVIQRTFRESGAKSFTLTVTDNDGLSNSSSSVSGELKVNHQPLIVTETVLRSNALSVKLDATSSYDLDENPLTFEWTLPDGTKRNESSFTWQASEPGVHFIGLTVNDGLGLENSIAEESIRILINRPVKAVVASEIASCTGQTVLFNSSQSFDPDGDPFSVNWSFGNGASSDQANPSYVYETPGIYEAKLTLNDGFTEEQTVATIPVIIEGSPVAKLNLSDTTICVNNSIRFDGSSSTDPSGSLPSFSWDTGDGKSKTGAVIDHIFTTPGVYTVSLTVEGSGSGRCSNISQTTATVTVVEGPEASFELPEYTIPGKAVTLDGSASSADGGFKSAKWVIDSEKGQEVVEGLNTTYTFDEPGEYLVSLELETNSETNCNTVSITKSIKVNAPPVINWNLPSNIPAGTDLKLDALSSRDPDGFVKSYKWYMDGQLISENAAEIIKAIQPGDHTVKLEITDNTTATNNTASVEKTFFANSKPSPSIIAPEAVYLNETVSFRNASTLDRDEDVLTSTWKLDGNIIPSPTFEVTNPQGHKLVLIQNDNRGLSNSIDSAVIRVTPKVLPVANPDLPKLIAVGGALSLADIRMENPWRFKNQGQFSLTWTSTTPGNKTLTLAYVQNGSELVSQEFSLQVVPRLSFTESPETQTIEWNPANPSIILKAPSVNREDSDVIYTWKQRGSTLGTGKQIGVQLVKGENRFTVQVTDQRVARSSPITIDVVIITE
ncbi:MAG: PKD domain-containing protein [Balneola sp.]